MDLLFIRFRSFHADLSDQCSIPGKFEIRGVHCDSKRYTFPRTSVSSVRAIHMCYIHIYLSLHVCPYQVAK